MEKTTISKLFKEAAKHLRSGFEYIRVSNPHSAEKGAEVENVLRTFLNQHMPQRFHAGSGFIIDKRNMKGTCPMLKKFAFLILASTLIVGCASTMKLSESNKAKLNTIYCGEDVIVTQGMYYMGPGAAIFGAIGAVTQIEPGERLRLCAIENGIRIEDIVKEAVLEELNAKGYRVTESADQSLSVMKLEVYWYGFSVPNGFSSNLVPVLGVKAQLEDTPDSVIWKNDEGVQVFGNPVEPIPAKELVNSADKIRMCWTEAAAEVAKKLTAEF